VGLCGPIFFKIKKPEMALRIAEHHFLKDAWEQAIFRLIIGPMSRVQKNRASNRTHYRMTEDSAPGRQLYQKIGLIAGPLVGLIIFFLFRPEGVSPSGTYVAAIATWMAIWWATEATHVAVTALLPLILFPIMGVGKMSVTASSYAHPIVYLFMGGFIMAIAIERSRLHLRVALNIFKMAGVKARSLVGGLRLSACGSQTHQRP